ncbi:MAG: hypothetical protein N3G21_02075 [Candidatus Hydrogenedentes bacterium]|nr:hypothetical protein [Candidatus Hydrogenedentota bacterium]
MNRFASECGFGLLFTALLSIIPLVPSDSNEPDVITASFSSFRGAILLNPRQESGNFGYFLLDSGVSVPVIDEKLAREAINIEGEGSINITSEVLENFLSIPHMESSKILLEDLFPLSRKLGVRIFGVIPLYFPGYEVFLDFGDGRVGWCSLSMRTKEKIKKIPTVELNFSASTQIPRVLVILNRRYSIVANVDITKGEHIGLPLRVLNERKIGVRDMKFAHFEGKREVCYFKLDSIRVASLEMKNVVGVASVDEIEPWLGIKFWRNFGVGINYELGKIYFLVRNEDLEEGEWSGTGVLLDCLIEEGWLVGVIEDSSAWESGIVPGDLLISIESKNANSVFVEDLLKLLNGDKGREVKCVFKSKVTGVKKEVILKCRSIL